MTSLPAILPFDGPAPSAAKPAGAVPADGFSDLLGSLGGDPVPAGAESAEGEQMAAAGAQGGIAALAAMLASVTTMKGSHKGAAPAKAREEDRSTLEPVPRKSHDADGATGAVLQLAAALPPGKPVAACTKTDVPGAASASVPVSPVRAAAVTGVAVDRAAQVAGADVARAVGPAGGGKEEGAETPVRRGPATSAVPASAKGPALGPGLGPTLSPAFRSADPLLGTVASLVQRDDRATGAGEFGAPKVEPGALLPAATPFLHSPAASAPGAAGMRQDPPAMDQSVAHYLDLARDGEWLDRLAGDIARTAGRSGTLRFHLHPEALGRLHVEMSQGTAGASIRLTTDTETARNIIADAQPRLVAEARAQGVRIAETHVALGAGGQWSSPGQQGQRQAVDPFLRTSGPGSPGAGGDEPRALSDRGAGERYA